MSQTYIEWFSEFIKGKREVPVSETHDRFASHSTRRFVDQTGDIWEIASTYTGRLIVRKGLVAEDGVTIGWEDWITEHNVVLPKLHSGAQDEMVFGAVTTQGYSKKFPLARRP